jgi:hypothetical protein
MMNQPSPFHGPTTPAPFMFDDQSKVLYVRLQYGSLLPYEIQEREIPFIPIDLSRISYRPDGDNVEMAFRDDWLLGHLLPRVWKNGFLGITICVLGITLNSGICSNESAQFLSL